MKKYNLALIGKNISHSLSPVIYKDLLGDNVDYSLLDFPDSNNIPLLLDLFNNLNGLSVTSPYKEFFINQVELIGKAKDLKALNCIRINNNKLEGCNTDYLAILEILNKEKDLYQNIIILGDGVMSRVTQFALRELNISYEIYSRKLTKDFYKINLSELVGNKNTLVINTCSREYVYKGDISNKIKFWDFNYNFNIHKELLSKKCNYVDGYEMLVLQAKHALVFWSIT